jgi:nitroreductase
MSDVLKLIRERKSGRGPFDPNRPVSKQDLERILEAGSWAPTAHNMQNFEFVVIDDAKVLDALAKLKSPVSMDFIKENYRQLSFSEEELKRKKVGILATRFPPAWSNPEASPDELAATERTLPVSSVMLFMLYDPSRRAPASEGDFLGIISLGNVTQNMWLMASTLGVGFHLVSSFGDDAIEKEAKRILGIPDSLRIVYAIRLGYPVTDSEYLRVRREVNDFTHHNRFGNKGLT